MSRRGARGSDQAAGEAEVVQVRVSVLDTPAGRARRPGRLAGRGATRPGRLAVLAAALLGGGLVIFVWAGATSRPRVPAAARAPGAVGVAGAYGFPRGCLSITIMRQHPAYARADFDRRQACGRYTGDPTAVFHRSGGAWHMVLDAAAYTCPVAGIPGPVQAALGVCDSGPHAP